MSRSKIEWSYVFLLVAATFFMGASFIASKILLQTIPPFLLVGTRFFVAALATLPLVAWLDVPSKAPPSVRPVRWLVVGAIGLLQTAGTMGLLFLSMLYVSASTAAILLFTNPLWVAVLGRFFLNEKWQFKTIIGLLTGVLGVALCIGFQQNSTEIKGAVLGWLSSLCWASATIVNKKYPSGLSTWRLSFWQMLIGGLCLLAFSFGLNEPLPTTIDAPTVAWFLWLAIPSSTGSFCLWFLALQKGGATQSSAFLFLAPLFTVLLSALILDKTPSVSQALGGILVCLALILVYFERSK